MTGSKKAAEAKGRNLGSIQQADGTEIKVHWDTGRLQTSYANVCNVSSTREEVTLLFGTNQGAQQATDDLPTIRVELTDRVILNPFAAKRLALALEQVIQNYESRFGTLQLEVTES